MQYIGSILHSLMRMTRAITTVPSRMYFYCLYRITFFLRMQRIGGPLIKSSAYI